MAEINSYFVSEAGVQQFAADIFGKVNLRVASKITSEYNSEDEVSGVTGKAVATAVKELADKVDGLTHLTITTVIGSINDIETPDKEVLYFQKDDENDKTWSLYVYREDLDDHWVLVGDTSTDLVDYWKKIDVAELHDALGIKEYDVMTTD